MCFGFKVSMFWIFPQHFIKWTAFRNLNYMRLK